MEVVRPVPFVGHTRLTIGLVMGVLTFWLFAQSMVNVIPAVHDSLNHTSQESLNLAVSLTSLFSGCFTVVVGGLADRLGRMRITYLGFVLSIIGCLCLIFAQGTALLMLGRIIQGLSAACIMPATLSLIKSYYSGAERQKALSYWSIGSWGGSGMCSLFGGAIATSLGWRWIFVFSILCAVLGLILIRGTPESKNPPQQKTPFDYSGLFTFVLALVSLNLLITRSSTMSTPLVLALLAIFLFSAGAFFALERRKGSDSLIDFALFKNRSYSGAVASNFLLNGAAGTMVVASLYVQRARGFTSFESGLLTLGYLVTVLLMIRVGEKLLQRAGARQPMLAGTAICGSGIAMMAFTTLPGSLYAISVFVGYILFGLGLGIYATPSTDTAVHHAPLEKIGIATGIYKMASALGGGFGIALSAATFTALQARNIHAAATTGLLINVGFCALSLLMTLLFIPARTAQSTRE